MVCQEKKFNKKTIKGYGSAATQNIGKKRDPHIILIELYFNGYVIASGRR
jgi:hypothetical protein